MIRNALFGGMTLALAPLFAAAPASAQVDYNRSVVELTYAPSESGKGFDISGAIDLEGAAAITYDLGYQLSVMVNGEVVGEPWTVGALVAGGGASCTEWCAEHCAEHACFHLFRRCWCLIIISGPPDETLPGAFTIAVPGLSPGDIVSARIEALPGTLAEIDTSDDELSVVVGEPACRADFNGDASVNSQDFFDFLGAFFASDPSADFNADTQVNSQDFFDFVGAFFAGC